MQIVLLIKLNWNFMIFILGSPYIYHVCEEFSHLWAKHFDYAMNIFKQLLKQRTIDLCALTHRQVFFYSQQNRSIHGEFGDFFFVKQIYGLQYLYVLVYYLPWDGYEQFIFPYIQTERQIVLRLISSRFYCILFCRLTRPCICNFLPAEFLF